MMRLSRLLLLLLLLVPALARADGPSMSLRAFMPETPLTQLAQLQPPSMLSTAPVPGSVNPHVWYFSNQGNDSASCHTIASACKTIAHHNAVQFGPNDQVFWNGNDATCQGSISGTTLTVASCASGTIHLKDPLFWANQPITSRPTQVLSQTSGTTGGAGTYTVSVSQTLGGSPGTQTAKRVSSFLDGIGINVHMVDNAGPYGNLPLVESELNSIGVHLLRDSNPVDYLISSYQTIATAGNKWDFVIGTNPDVQMNTSYIASELALINQIATSNPGSVVGVEGLNEPVNFPNYWNGVLTTTWALVFDVQSAEWTAVQADSSLTGVPLLNTSPSTGPSDFPAPYPNFDSVANLGNGHVYPYTSSLGSQPPPVLQNIMNGQAVLVPGLSVWVTEFGWSAAPQDTSGYGVNQQVQGYNNLNGLLDDFVYPSPASLKTFIYELNDEITNPSPSDVGNNWGLFSYSGVAKPSATYLGNLTTILADTGATRSTFTPTATTAALSGMPAAANSTLLQKSNLTFELVVWSDAANWNSSTHSQITVAPTTVTVSFGASQPTVNIYDPTVSTAPITTRSNVSSVTISLTDHPLIVEFPPGAGATTIVFGQTFADACPVINATNLPTSGGSFSEQSYGGGNAAILSSATCAGTNSGSQGPRKPLLNIDSVTGVIWNGVLLFANGTATQFGAQMSNSHNISIELAALVGFNTTATGDSSAEIQIQGDLDGANSGLTISDNFLGGANGAISPDDCGICSIGNGLNNTNLTITGNYILDEGTVVGHPPPAGEGITLTGVNTALVQFNRVTAVGANSASCGGPSGIETYDASNVTVFHNEVDNITVKSGGCDGDGIDFDGDSHNNVAWGNFVHDTVGWGVGGWVGPGNVATTWGPNYYYNNIIQNGGTEGGEFSAFSLLGPGASNAPAQVYVVGNTIYQSWPTSSTTNDQAVSIEVNCCGTSNNVQGLFANNIVAVSANNFGDNTYISFATNTEPNFQFAANDYFPITPGTFLVNQYGANGYTSLASWAAAAPGGEAGSLNVNPGFAGTPPNAGCGFLGGSPGPAPCPNQYELAAGSALLGAGLTPTGPPYNLPNVPATDYYGNAQGGAAGYSIGAFNGASTAPTITSITSSCTGSVTFGTPCTYSVNFNANVYVGGSWHPRLNLATSPVPSIAYYCGGSGTRVLMFCHEVWGGQIAGTVVTSSAALNLNGSTLAGVGGANAILTGANSVAFNALTYAPGNAWCVNPSSGSDSSSGVCPTAFKTPAKAQTTAQGSAVKTIFLESGTYSGLATSTFTGYDGTPDLTAYIYQTSADNGEIWAAYPGQTPVWDGGSTANNNGVSVPFYSNGVNGTTREGLTVQHFSGGAFYDQNSFDVTNQDNTIQNLFNNGAGAGGAVFEVQQWTSPLNSHNLIQNVAGFGLNATTAETGLGGYNFALTDDMNSVINSCTGVADCGALYSGFYFAGNTTGFSAGTVKITNNFVQNVGSANSTGNCNYNDDYASGVLFSGNICTGLYTWGVLIHNGLQNTITDNVFDISELSQYGSGAGSGCPGQGGCFSTPFYMPNSQVCSQGGSCKTAANNNINGNIIFNRGPFSPPAYMGLYYNNSPNAPPTMGTNWYGTLTGSFQNPPFQWGFPAGGGATGLISDPAGVTLSGDPFVNSAAQTAAGFQLISGSVPLAGGFPQPAQGQGPR